MAFTPLPPEDNTSTNSAISAFILLFMFIPVIIVINFFVSVNYLDLMGHRVHVMLPMTEFLLDVYFVI